MLGRVFDPLRALQAAARITARAGLIAVGVMTAGPEIRPTMAQPVAAPPVQRICKPRLEWSALGSSRSLAQHRTLDGWSAAVAAAHGETYADWRRAGVARLSCTLTPDGHRCRAAASPCSGLKPRVGKGTSG